MLYYIIAGERSGDLHAGNLIKEIKILDPHAKFRVWGGDYMREQGAIIVRHYKHMNFMGLIEVLLNLPIIFMNLRKCKKDILKFRPDVVILVDFSGFNLKIAAFAKKNNLKVHYYISPKIWAWNPKRVHTIKKNVDHMYVILPFEKSFYAQFGYHVDYVGNPVVDAVRNFKPDPEFKVKNQLDDRPILAILPGSRKSEVENMLHFMVSVLPAFKNYQFVIAAVGNLDRNYYEHFRREGIVYVIYDQTYDILSVANAALVTSGTATLETALFKVPQVVCFATNPLMYLIGKPLVKVKYISLPNLIADKEIVKELIQDNFSPVNVIEELIKIVYDEENRNRILSDYNDLIQKLGQDLPSKKTAQLLIGYMQSDK